jgi:hypothetical protein
MDISTQNKFPFNSVLNLRLLIEHWEKSIAQGNVPGFSQGLINAINEAPELREPISDLSVLDRHKSLINFLITAVIPAANQENEIAAAIFPFDFKALYSTKAFERTLDLNDIDHGVTTNLPNNQMMLGKTVKACLLILQKLSFMAYESGWKSRYFLPCAMRLQDWTKSIALKSTISFAKSFRKDRSDPSKNMS